LLLWSLWENEKDQNSKNSRDFFVIEIYNGPDAIFRLLREATWSWHMKYSFVKGIDLFYGLWECRTGENVWICWGEKLRDLYINHTGV
jgi:hypothetical protein